MDKISIVLPVYKTDPEVTVKVVRAIVNQKSKYAFDLVVVDKGIDKITEKEIKKIKKKNIKVKWIKVNPNLSFAGSMNIGIKAARYSPLIILQQDCMPWGDKWVDNLIDSAKKEGAVAATSKVELPYELWKIFDPIAKILSSKEQKVITPALDEKGCAYRREALIKVGLFDDKTYRTAGEDADMYIKLKKIGRIEYPEIKLIHYHKHNWKNRMKKELQLSNGFGAIVRNNFYRMPNWYIGFIKAVPLLGYPLFLLSIDVKKIKWLTFIAIPLMFAINLIYSYGFWKGFISGKQTV